MKLRASLKLLKRKMMTSLACAKEEGMVVGKGVTVMGSVDFGSEPYLINDYVKK